MDPRREFRPIEVLNNYIEDNRFPASEDFIAETRTFSPVAARIVLDAIEDAEDAASSASPKTSGVAVVRLHRIVARWRGAK